MQPDRIKDGTDVTDVLYITKPQGRWRGNEIRSKERQAHRTCTFRSRLKPRSGGLCGALLKPLQIDFYVFTLELMFLVAYQSITSVFQASATFGVLRILPFLTAANDILAILGATASLCIEKSLTTCELAANDRDGSSVTCLLHMFRMFHMQLLAPSNQDFGI